MPAPRVVQTLASALPDVDSPLPPAAAQEWASLQLAAVLVLLYPRAGDVRFLLTARPDTLTHHPGQISLPGGRVEADETPWQAAVRETREELGIRLGRLVPIGRLATVPTVVSNHLIVPFVGWNPIAPRITPYEHEVASVLEVPLSAIADRSNVEEETWELRRGPAIVTFYRFDREIVWGATARVLSDLACYLVPGLDWGFPPGWVRLLDE